MTITLLSQRQLATFLMLSLSALLEFFLMKMVPDGMATIVFLVSALILFYFSIEVAQNFITTPITLDFRSAKQRKRDEEDRSKNLIEGLRNNLLMQIANNQISQERAEALYFSVKKFEENTNPLEIEKLKALQFREQLHKQLDITNERI